MRILEGLESRLPRDVQLLRLTDDELQAIRELPQRDVIALTVRVRRAERSLRLLREQLSSLWRVVPICPRCDRAVLGRKGKEYCSAACRQAAYEARVAGAP